MEHIEQDGLSPDFKLPSFPNLKNKFNLALLALAFTGLFLLAIGAGLFLFRGSTASDDIKIISATESAATGSIVVHVDGAVKAPGVYHLNSDSRVNDAISAAGGFSKDADTTKVNLAAKLSDGQKIHVAMIGEAGSTLGTKSTGGTGGTTLTEVSGLVSINSASQSELEGLPAVGPVTAGKIIGGRPYSQVDELVSKKIVGKATFGKIKELISI